MTAILINERERGRFLRFMVVGVFGAIVDFGTFNLMSGALKVQPVVASVISFTAAIINNFLWNRYWTYPDSRSKSMVQQLIQFAGISILGLLIRTPLFAWLSGLLPPFFERTQIPLLSSFSADFLGHNLALAIAVVVVMFWNFFVNRYWTYNDVK